MRNFFQNNPIAHGNYLIFIALIPVVLIAGYPLSSSLWLDETITYLLIKDGTADVIQRTLAYQSHSPLYFLVLWVTTKFTGMGEIGLRLPSLMSAALTSLFTYKIARRMTDREGASIAVILLLCLDTFVKSSVNARPYSVAMLCCTLSVYALLSWLDTAKFSWQIVYVLSTVLTFYMQYIFGMIIIIHAFIIFSNCLQQSRVTRREILATCTVLALLMLPVFVQQGSLRNKLSLYQFSQLPSIKQLLLAMLPPALITYVVCGVVFARIYSKVSVSKKFLTPLPSAYEICALILWYAFPPLALFILSFAQQSSLFFWRFYCWYSVPLAILIALLIRAIEQQKARAICISIIFLLVLCVPRQWRIEDWRQTAEAVNTELAKNSTLPILAYTGLIELDSMDWLRDTRKREYFTAPFAYYPIKSTPILIPSSFESAEARKYFHEIVAPVLKGRFILISPKMEQFSCTNAVCELPKYFLDFFEAGAHLAGQFKGKILYEAGLIFVLEFESTTAGINLETALL